MFAFPLPVMEGPLASGAASHVPVSFCSSGWLAFEKKHNVSEPWISHLRGGRCRFLPRDWGLL